MGITWWIAREPKSRRKAHQVNYGAVAEPKVYPLIWVHARVKVPPGLPFGLGSLGTSWSYISHILPCHLLQSGFNIRMIWWFGITAWSMASLGAWGQEEGQDDPGEVKQLRGASPSSLVVFSFLLFLGSAVPSNNLLIYVYIHVYIPNHRSIHIFNLVPCTTCKRDECDKLTPACWRRASEAS